jgi:hypothetical protein
MILTFDYPWHRKDIYDRRLWSDINSSLAFEEKKYDLMDTVVIVTIFKGKKVTFPKQKYFSLSQLEILVNIILTRSNIKFNICELFYREKEIYGKTRIRVEFLTKGEDNASTSN